MRAGHRLVAVVVAVTAAACSSPAPPPPAPARESVHRPAGPPPDVNPRGLSHVNALAVGAGSVLVGTDEGLVWLDAQSGDYRLESGEGFVSHRLVMDVAVDDDGTAWTAHGVDRMAPTGEEQPRSGGVRAWQADGGGVRAFFADDGLGDDDVACIGAGGGRVAACAGAGLALLVPGGDEEAPPRFEAVLGGTSRRLTLVDPDLPGDAGRSVVEFRPPTERALTVAVSGERVHLGTTHGLYTWTPEANLRIRLACHPAADRVSRVVALAAAPGGSLAVLLGQSEQPDGGWRPGGVAVLPAGGGVRCLFPGMDVPDAVALDLAMDGDTVYVATHAGLARVTATLADLLDPLSGAPAAPVTAVAVDGEGGCWIGAWGLGVAHVVGERWRLYSFGDEPVGRASITEGALR